MYKSIPGLENCEDDARDEVPDDKDETELKVGDVSIVARSNGVSESDVKSGNDDTGRAAAEASHACQTESTLEYNRKKLILLNRLKYLEYRKRVQY